MGVVIQVEGLANTVPVLRGALCHAARRRGRRLRKLANRAPATIFELKPRLVPGFLLAAKQRRRAKRLASAAGQWGPYSQMRTGVRGNNQVRAACI